MKFCGLKTTAAPQNTSACMHDGYHRRMAEDSCVPLLTAAAQHPNFQLYITFSASTEAGWWDTSA
jgi:hypothetical protein